MKKKVRTLILITCGIVALILSVYFLYSAEPLSNLNETEVAGVQVYAIPPDESVELSQDEMKECIKLLQDMKVSRPGYIYLLRGASGGQGVKITVSKTDGTILEVWNLGNVEIRVNGMHYKAEYNSVEAINSFVNKALKTGF